jgi:hypothetical protein
MSESNPSTPDEEERKAKQRARVKAWQEANKEKIAAQHKARYEAKKEEITAKHKIYRDAKKEQGHARQKAYYAANKEKCAAANKAWRDANKEKYDAAKNAYREANKERLDAYKRAWREANPEAHKLAGMKHHLQRKYGLTLHQFTEMLRACNHRCECCKTPFSDILNERSRVDHCHKTGIVRGILCQRCNRLLGDAEDNPSILRACARYLERTAKRATSIEAQSLD